MKPSVFVAVVMVILFYIIPVFTSVDDSQQHLDSQPCTRQGTVAEPDSCRQRRPVMKRKGVDTLQIVGSSLPDCSHACGSCKPCRLVMVSSVCASLEEAETCPMAYKCMCNNKSYPVPWNCLDHRFPFCFITDLIRLLILFLVGLVQFYLVMY